MEPGSPNRSSGDLEQYRPAITRYIRNMMRDSAEAEDLAQETFIRAFRQHAMLRDEGAVLSWLYQIATHISLDRLRQRIRLRSRQIEQPSEGLQIED